MPATAPAAPPIDPVHRQAVVQGVAGQLHRELFRHGKICGDLLQSAVRALPHSLPPGAAFLTVDGGAVQIGAAALQNFLQVNGVFPPAFGADGVHVVALDGEFLPVVL